MIQNIKPTMGHIINDVPHAEAGIRCAIIREIGRCNTYNTSELRPQHVIYAVVLFLANISNAIVPKAPTMYKNNLATASRGPA